MKWRAKLYQQGQALAVAIQFMTLLPVKLEPYPDKSTQGYSVLYYPVVGAIIGVFLFLLSALTHHVPPSLQAGLIILLWVVITGALHLDGLADTADGWLGGLGDKGRTLRIMKDPHVGTAGVIALILCLLLKWSALAEILKGQPNTMTVLILIPLVARWYALLLLTYTPYAHRQGIAITLTENTPKNTVLVCAILGAIALATLSWVWLIITFCLVLGLRRMFIRRLQGTTGDTLGASIECVELCLLVCYVVFPL